MLSASERQRMVNPRKAYPIDPGLIPLYERMGRGNVGQSLETAVLVELLRRGCEVHYLRTAGGHEVDFHAVDAMGRVILVQVCADVSDLSTFEREVRALVEAHQSHPKAQPVLILHNPLPNAVEVPEFVEVKHAVQWFLEDPVVH